MFHAKLVQNRSGSLALTDLYYDFPNQRNLNVILDQLSQAPLYDNERGNGSTYYYYPTTTGGGGAESCNAIDMGVGILRPDWLDGATYIGDEAVDGFQTHVFEQGRAPQTLDTPFITYYASVSDGRPVRWVFYDNASFEVGRCLCHDVRDTRTDHPRRWCAMGILMCDGAALQVMTWHVNETATDDMWQVPQVCFTEEGVVGGGSQRRLKSGLLSEERGNDVERRRARARSRGSGDALREFLRGRLG